MIDLMPTVKERYTALSPRNQRQLSGVLRLLGKAWTFQGSLKQVYDQRVILEPTRDTTKALLEHFPDVIELNDQFNDSIELTYKLDLLVKREAKVKAQAAANEAYTSKLAESFGIDPSTVFTIESYPWDWNEIKTYATANGCNTVAAYERLNKAYADKQKALRANNV